MSIRTLKYSVNSDQLQIASTTAVPIRTTDTAQTVVNAYPAGTTFIITAGVHTGFTLTLTTAHNGMRFIGEPGAVLDGAGANLYCIKGFCRDVVFRGWSDAQKMVIKNYTPTAPQSTVVACCTDPDQRFSMPGWELGYLALTDNANVSVRGGASSYIHDLTIANAGTVPLSGAGYGSPLRPCVVKNIVITNFNTSNSNPGFEGGVKFALCRYVDISNVSITANSNHAAAHDSAGLWFDGDCEHVVVRDCTISDVPRTGIQAEISGTMQIYNNTITNCGYAIAPTGWGFGSGAGITIAASGRGPLGVGIDVCDNTISNCNEGIVILEQSRGLSTRDWLTYYYSQNLRVMRNALNACGGSGVITDIPLWSSATTYGAGTAPSRQDAGAVYSGSQYFVSKQNSNTNHTPPASASDAWWRYVADWPFNLATRQLQWNQNTYTGSCGPTAQPGCPAPFYWAGAGQSYASWQAAGQDPNSSYA